MRHGHDMPYGVRIEQQNNARFRLWAPSAKRVSVKGRRPSGDAFRADLSAAEGGWYEARAEAPAGSTYMYRIDDAIDVPDPASRWNPGGVHSESVILDPYAFEWGDESWEGRPWEALTFYELHVGAFTPQGTYTAIESRLDDLVALGITAIELLPIASFAGSRGWGYDGVLPYAPHPAYGTPDELKQLIRSAHERKLCVLLDVVYNHFGPDGNYLGQYAREFFTHKHRTPWGDAIDFRNEAVRQFFIQNALYWIREFRFDGLRIDAVHAMFDDGPRHFIDELIDTVQDGPGRERQIHIVLENHLNESRRLARPRVSQWNDDIHHALHVLLTDESESYYSGFADRPLDHLGKALAEGFVYQGDRPDRSGKLRGEPSAHLPSCAFVSFLQNHDQIGNRAFGERIERLSDREPLRAAFALLLLAPQLPMLFMGEEYAAPQPFLYFCDYSGELADAVREGRRAEFAEFAAFADASLRETIPDPNAAETFERSRLKWEERTSAPHAEWLAYVAGLLQVRAARVVPLIGQIVPGRSQYRVYGRTLRVDWPLRWGATLSMMANLSAQTASPVGSPSGDMIFATHEPESDALAPWEVRVVIEERARA